MRILAISDIESPYYWDYFKKEKLEGIDLILSCGDLDPDYLSFLATFCREPVLYVHGNHDEGYRDRPPEGCICIENRVYVHKGIRILGLGGTLPYKKTTHSFTQKQMQLRVAKALPTIMYNRGFDILLAHAPARGINDGPDPAHYGYEVFLKLMERFRPACFVHGHVHMNYSHRQPRFDNYMYTRVVNAYERCVFDLDLKD